jgi:hypothetical protein
MHPSRRRDDPFHKLGGKNMRLRKIGAVLAGAAMLGATLVGAVSAGDQPNHDFWVNADGTPAAMIVVGDNAAASDVVSASLIAAKIGTMAVKVEELNAPSTVYTDTAINIDLAYTVPSFPIPIAFVNVVTEDIQVPYYKTWGLTTHWTHNDNAYVTTLPAADGTLEAGAFKFFNEVRVEYTIGGLWFYDEDSRCWWFTQPDGMFQPWETHEEIQIRFDDLYLVGGKEFQLSGYHFQDHVADLAGGDVDPARYIARENWETDIPGLIYRIDNIRRPRQKEIFGFALLRPYWEQWVDLHSQALNNYYIVEPYSIGRQWIPRIKVFGTEYKVVDATYTIDWDLRYRFMDPDWWLGKGFIIITGEPRFYLENYIYKDAPQTFDGFEVNVKDVDVDHNKVFLGITTPAGDSNEFWMMLDPLHGFSATPQLMSQSGEVTEYNGLSLNDIWFWDELYSYRDNAGHPHELYDLPTFAVDGIATFVGAGGTIGALFNIYTVSDFKDWQTQLCCVPYVTEPNNYSLFIDQQATINPCIGNYFPYADPLTLAAYTDPMYKYWTPSGQYPGFWYSIDSHCTTTELLIPGAYYNDGFYTYTHYIEAIPDVELIQDSIVQTMPGGAGYADRDPNDYMWWDEDAWDSRKGSHWWTYSSRGVYTSPPMGVPSSPATTELNGVFINGGDWKLPGFDYMWEMNFALCDIIEVNKCLTKYVIMGPNNYFRIEMGDITWDDNGDGVILDGADDGLAFRVVMEVPSGTYKQTTSVPLDPTSIVKLDIEVTDTDMADFNLVLVGGPVANVLVKKLVDMGKTPDDGSAADWAVTSGGDYKLYTNGFDKGKDVLVVAGANREETRKAAQELVASMG